MIQETGKTIDITLDQKPGRQFIAIQHIAHVIMRHIFETAQQQVIGAMTFVYQLKRKVARTALEVVGVGVIGHDWVTSLWVQ